MNIHSALIENYKNITQCEFVANGNNITISGVCGSGKSAILETLLIAILGKELLPDDPIRRGAESAKFEWSLGEGEKLQYTIKVIVKPDKFDLTLTGYLPNGAKCKIASPAVFLKSLIFKDALDPQSFFNKGDKEQLKDFYNLFPDLKAKLENNSLEYKAIQDARSKIKEQVQEANIDLERTPYIDGLPEQETDAVELMEELEKAKGHNKKLDIMVENRRKLEEACSLRNEKLENYQEELSEVDKEIKRLEIKKAGIVANIAAITTTIGEYQERIKAETSLIDIFVPIDTKLIQEKIANLTKTNEQIRQNQKRTELQAKVEKLRNDYSKGLEQMRAKEQERIDILKSVKMPIDGLTVGDNCLMYPNPTSGELVRLNSLSTGQKWRVAVKILAAFIPENGLRIMVINDLNALDETNHKAMLEAAKEVGVKLVMHKTLYKSDDSQCSITITD